MEGNQQRKQQILIVNERQRCASQTQMPRAHRNWRPAEKYALMG